MCFQERNGGPEIALLVRNDPCILCSEERLDVNAAQVLRRQRWRGNINIRRSTQGEWTRGRTPSSGFVAFRIADTNIGFPRGSTRRGGVRGH